jgi:hypothetical protein
VPVIASLLLALAAGDVTASLRGNAYGEPSASGRSPTYVVGPSVEAKGTSGDVGVSARYDLDVVSGASERIAHVVSSASPYRDTRHSAAAGLSYRPGATRLDLSYAFSTESDFRSHAVSASMQTEVLSRNTTLGAGYLHGWDRTTARLENGATGDHDDPLDTDSISVLLGQVLGPATKGELGYTLTVARGYQANPYRRVILYDAGEAAAFNERVEPESHPLLRVRHGVGLRGSRFFAGPGASIGIGARLYRDSWGLSSAALETEWNQHLGQRSSLRLRLRGSAQQAALFYRDRYTRGPIGRYFSGDPELADLWTASAGLKLDARLGAGEGGFWDRVAVVVKVDGILFFRDLGNTDTSFTLSEDPRDPSRPGRYTPDDGRAFVAQLGLEVSL